MSQVDQFGLTEQCFRTVSAESPDSSYSIITSERLLYG